MSCHGACTSNGAESFQTCLGYNEKYQVRTSYGIGKTLVNYSNINLIANGAINTSRSQNKEEDKKMSLLSRSRIFLISLPLDNMCIILDHRPFRSNQRLPRSIETRCIKLLL